MTVKDWVILVIIAFVALIFLIKYGESKYEEGFGVGCLIAFYWIQTNTSCKDAVDTYLLVSKEHPEDAIYICEREGKNSFKIKPNAKALKLDKL